jgi:hypothetical protein
VGDDYFAHTGIRLGLSVRHEKPSHPSIILCYAIVPPGRKSAFRAGFWPDCYRESTAIGPPTGRRVDFGAFPVAVRPKSSPEDQLTARRRYCVTSDTMRDAKSENHHNVSCPGGMRGSNRRFLRPGLAPSKNQSPAPPPAASLPPGGPPPPRGSGGGSGPPGEGLDFWTLLDVRMGQGLDEEILDLSPSSNPGGQFG